MGIDILLGLQWGDEGKGKIVDVLAPNYDYIARFQGGPNAGHTLEFDGIKHVLHQIPSGIFHKGKKNIIGNGVVLDPVIFNKEVNALVDKFQVSLNDTLFISGKATLILPTHRALDAAYEKSKGKNKIGSTLKGIGPCYQDKIARVGLRVGDILADNFRERYDNLVEAHKQILDFYNHEFDLDELNKEFFAAIDSLKSMNIVESEYMINEAISSNKSVLAEGAQGTMLDVNFGSYPFVTSSNTVTAGACVGLGVAPKHVDQVYGIFKAYCTRVGGGPFPTELNDVTGDKLQKEGNEFGATTGRPRRCGWLDLPALNYAVMINGVTQMFMMKADVLNSFEEIKVCTHYKLPDGTVTEKMPHDIDNIDIEPVYKTFKGWNTSLEGIAEVDQLPAELLEYIAFIEKETGVPITIVSVGPDRKQTLQKNQVPA